MVSVSASTTDSDMHARDLPGVDQPRCFDVFGFGRVRLTLLLHNAQRKSKARLLLFVLSEDTIAICIGLGKYGPPCWVGAGPPPLNVPTLAGTYQKM